jgi:hypothetical protein
MFTSDGSLSTFTAELDYVELTLYQCELAHWWRYTSSILLRPVMDVRYAYSQQ